MPRPNRVTKLSAKPHRIQPPAAGPFRLRLAGAHQQREEGFLGIDGVQTDSVDYVADLKTMPWPINDGLVDTVFSANYFHRLDQPERFAFMDECWRVLKTGSQLILVTPHWSSMRAISDPRAKWPPIGEASFVYFNKQWRADNGEESLGIACDFDFGYGLGLDPEIQLRNTEYQQHATKHWVNAALDLHITLTKRG